MNKESRGAFLSTLRKMSKKGFYETLEYICKNESVHYADIMKVLIESKVVESRATVTLIVRGLLKLNLVERTVMDSRPVRTVYKSTEMGSEVLQLLQKIEATVQKE
jgi:DNA-binding HxlR family transcriptional regulator